MEKFISGSTTLIGLLANPIKHSFSPKMHNAAFKELGLDYAYLAFEVKEEQLEAAVYGLKAMNARGCNVSMPYKQKIIKYMDKLTLTSELCGAVNTVINDNGVLTGHITDGSGYMNSLKDAGFDVIGKKISLAGAGGAATAICIQAALDGVKEISIFNKRDKFYEKAQETVKIINEKTTCIANLFDIDDKDKLKAEINESAIFINATGIGMKPYEGQTFIEKDMLRPELIVSDIIYEPEKTKLLEIAEEVGCPTINGIGMMIFQGAESFKCWTGKDMNIENIKNIINKKANDK
ncbi:shikimate dehydrogenase [uncultured Clostridium sp.]|uniref:shikimate dehydrogenase n=1 Tax=uncultured Clostridium sp. TaxID=59620 RepID=UPI0025EDE29F|nr:shikimate dehydrogenase [uncultured Clostridium sp.]